VGLDDKPISRRSGFQEFGLPFAPDAAITRYLAAFLTAHRHVALDESQGPPDHDPARPDVVLFNGGVFESPLLRGRLLEVLESWFSGRQPLAVSQMPGAPSSWTTTGSIWPWPAAPPTTAWCGVDKACGSPPDWPARTTSALNPPIEGWALQCQ